jgi:tetratricopeptide (TPR) repeat protein
MERGLAMVKGWAANRYGRRVRAAIACAALVAGAALSGTLLSGCRSGDLDKGQACLALGDYPLAQRFFGRAVEADPGGYEGRLGLGQALLQKAFADNDSLAFAGALIQLEACRSLRPSAEIGGLLAEAWMDRARGRLRSGDTLDALAALSKAIDRDPRDARPVNLAGIVYGKLGEAGKAEALFRKALALDSADASAHFNLGMLRWQAGGVREAHAQWLAALKTLPNDEDILYWFALAEKKMRESP